MAEEQVLKVVITADDKASGVLHGVGGVLKNIGIVAATAAVAGVAILAGAFVKLGIDALAAGGEAQEMLSKLDATFGSAGASMSATLTQFATDAGRSRFELLGMATDLGAVAKALGFTEEAAAKLSSEMTQLAVDVGSFNNLPAADVAERFTRALTGEFESLKALGIVINETVLNQELLNMGVEGGTQAATAYERALAVQNIIMRQTTDAQGDAIRTSDSWTNTMIRLKSIVSDFVTELGMKLIPILTPLAQKFTALAQNALPILTDFFDNVLLPALGRVVDAFMALLEGDFEGALEALFPPSVVESVMAIFAALQPLIDFIGANLIPILLSVGGVVAAGVVAAFLAMAAAAWAFVAPFVPIVAAIVAVIAIVAALAAAWRNNFGGMRTAIQSLWATIAPVFQSIVAWFQQTIPAAIQTLSRFWQGVLLPAIKAVMGFLQTTVFPLVSALAELIGAILAKALQAVAGLWQNVLLPAIKAVMAFITGTVVPIIKGTLGPVLDWLSNTVLAGLIRAFNVIIGVIKTVIGWIKDLAAAIASVSLPDWMTPGSPTPLELGLLGIADAFREVSDSVGRGVFPGVGVAPVAALGAGGASGGAAGLGGGNSNVTVIYAPSLSTASEDELKENLAPILAGMGVRVG